MKSLFFITLFFTLTSAAQIVTGGGHKKFKMLIDDMEATGVGIVRTPDYIMAEIETYRLIEEYNTHINVRENKCFKVKVLNKNSNLFDTYLRLSVKQSLGILEECDSTCLADAEGIELFKTLEGNRRLKPILQQMYKINGKQADEMIIFFRELGQKK